MPESTDGLFRLYLTLFILTYDVSCDNATANEQMSEESNWQCIIGQGVELHISYKFK